MPPNNLPEPGEFTRIFKRTHQVGAQSGQDEEKKDGEISGIYPAPEALPASPSGQAGVPPPASAPSQITPPAEVAPASAAPPRGPASSFAAPGPSSNEPGEFTQYFMGGLPGKAASSGGAPPSPRVPSGVQRPNTPMPAPRNLASDNSGSFTEKFAVRRDAPPQRADEFGMNPPRFGSAPDLSKGAPLDEQRPFEFKPQTKRDESSEFERMFGEGSLPPPPRQSAVAPPPLPPMMSDSPNSLPGGGERTMRDIPVKAPQVSSETPLASGGVAPADVAAGGAAATRKMPSALSVNVANPLAAIPSLGGGLPGASAHASMTGAGVNTPVGAANLNAPAIPPLNIAGGAAAAGALGTKTPKLSDQTKIILFFGLLAILAVILVVVLVAIKN